MRETCAVIDIGELARRSASTGPYWVVLASYVRTKEYLDATVGLRVVIYDCMGRFVRIRSSAQLQLHRRDLLGLIVFKVVTFQERELCSAATP